MSIWLLPRTAHNSLSSVHIQPSGHRRPWTFSMTQDRNSLLRRYNNAHLVGFDSGNLLIYIYEFTGLLEPRFEGSLEDRLCHLGYLDGLGYITKV